ncbi:MAG TPA: 5'-nucleotidase C-terminal domain-containing protein [Longimicrobiaceae bacterium]|jgi:5'-nucleotidase|nr:5'-nucleotidase C-terminal domain-containing protein [Longimicrobiaceae bacterium]
MTAHRTPIRRIAAAALLLACAAGQAAAQGSFRTEFAVVQLNDIYRIDAVAGGAAGGLGRVSTVVGRVKRETGAPVMILHAGDFIAPSLESRYFGGLQMIDAMNFLNARAPLVVVPGNHEFDERQPGMLAAALDSSRFRWLSGNVRIHTGDAMADARVGTDTVMTVGGMRVGIFTLSFLDSPRTYATPDDDRVAAAERQIRELEARGADVIVGLTHLEMAQDRQVARLHRTHPKFLWIAGGHEHYLERDELTDSTALITKGDSNARRIWKVFFGRVAGAPRVRAEAVALDSTVAIDPAYRTAITEKWAARVREKVPFFDTRIGTAATVLDGTEETVRNAESTWASWLADQMRGAFPDAKADLAFLNGGAIRVDDTFTGPIRWEHLARSFGFPTRVGLVWLTGRDVRETILERSVSGGRGEGRFMQVSGLKFRFDRRRPEGQRVVDVQVQNGDSWTPMDEAKVYVVAVPDYAFGGGDGYTFRERASRTVPPGPDVKYLAFDALAASYAKGQPIAPRIESRIVEVK